MGVGGKGVAPTVATFYHKDLCKDSVLFLSVFSFLLQLQQLFLLRLASASVSEDERERERERKRAVIEVIYDVPTSSASPLSSSVYWSLSSLSSFLSLTNTSIR